MKNLITWNVNGIRAILKKGFSDWLIQEDPDIICIQETKAHRDQIPEEFQSFGPYQSFWANSNKKGYSGVCVYTKFSPLEVENLGNESFDQEGRVQVLYFENFAIVNAYFPNSQENGRRLPYKLSFCEAILNKCHEIEKQGSEVVLCGDYNIAHKPIDLKNPDENEQNPGYLPQERKWMTHFLSEGFVDIFRSFNKEPQNYTWWSYRQKARPRNLGWRIDYHCATQNFLDKIENCEIQNEVLGSDHCPVKLILKSN